MARTVIRKLVARDEPTGVDVVIEPGACIQFCRIHRTPSPISEDDVYVMEFEVEGRQLRCALAQFQARTEAAPASVDELPAARAAVTV